MADLLELPTTRSELVRWQERRLAQLLPTLASHPLYAERVAGIRSITDLSQFPFTTKADLLALQASAPPFGPLMYPVERYCRLHQSSGTSTGRPLRWLDTPTGWDWLLGCWQRIFRILELRPSDRLFFPFSFGPFLGFWSAFEAATRAGHFCIPGGGLSSPARLRLLLECGTTVLFATPTYALHLVEVAQSEGLELVSSPVRMVIVAGEPGGSIPATRQRIADGWGARVIDHHGLTEVGPVALECPEEPGALLVLESEYITEVIDPQTLKVVEPGQVGELVLTNLGRFGNPVLRYRTGDLVQQATWPNPIGRIELRLAGGVLGRADDMIHVRGNNLYPAAIEAVVRRFAEIVEFRLTVDHSGPMMELLVEIEPMPTVAGDELARRVQQALRDELLFRIPVTPVAAGTLPRFEMKAKRVRVISHSGK